MRALGALLLALGVAANAAADKRALLVGINDYTKGPAEWDLRGCENDVQMTRRLLVERYGFPEANIKVLLNGDATAAAILAAIEAWLVKPVKAEDAVYFHFSGHGSQVRDFEGDEEDGYDEIICPADMQQGMWASVITDDQLRAALDRVPARHATIVLDACHSGTGTRDISLSRPRFAHFEAGPAPRGLKGETGTSPKPQALGAGAGGQEKKWVTISGCRPDQTSADAWIRDGFYAGALTYHLVENMTKAAPGTSFGTLMAQVSRDLQGASYAQVPQAEGDLDQAVLGLVPEPVRPPHALVQRVEGGKVYLSGALSLASGAIAAAFPPDDLRLEGTGKGRLKIVEVFGDSATALILEGLAPQPGFRVREVWRPVTPAKLKLLVEAGVPEMVQSLRAALAPLAWIEIAADGERFDHRLLLDRKEGIWQGTLTIDGKVGGLATGPGPEELVEALRPQLENAHALKFLAGLDNPEPPFRVEIWADSSTGARETPQKLVQAKEGAVLTFSFRAEQDCHLTLVDLGTTGKITVLFPNQFQPDGFVKAGQVYRTGTRGVLPFQIRAAGPPGRELVKVIAAADSLAFSSLRLGKAGAAGTRSIEASSEFVHALARDLSVEALPETTVTIPPAAGRWATDYLIVETLP